MPDGRVLALEADVADLRRQVEGLAALLNPVADPPHAERRTGRWEVDGQPPRWLAADRRKAAAVSS